MTLPPNSGPLNLNSVQAASNIFLLSTLSGMAFSICTNGGWYDSIFFLTPQGFPLDISGINFHAELRLTAGDARNQLDISTYANPPTMVNGGSSGALYLSVDVSFISNLSPGQYVMDVLAIDIASGMVRNLCEAAPLQVTVSQGVTR